MTELKKDRVYTGPRRPIYRAWSESQKGYVNADMLYVQADPIFGDNGLLDDMGEEDEFIPGDIIFEQFTGMYDRKGHRVYEGDVLLVNDPSSDNSEFDEYRYLEIRYCAPGFYFYMAETVDMEDVLDGVVLDAVVTCTAHDTSYLEELRSQLW